MNRKRPTNPLVSLIVPVYNEEESVSIFFATIQKVFFENNISFEVVFIDDGSDDRTLEKLLELADTKANIRIVSLSRNFGKETALTAGIDYAHGDIMIPIDVDLQDPPEVIPQFMEKWRDGYDVVYGTRIARRHDSLHKRTSAVWFYRIFNKLSRIKIPENAGDFRLIDRKVADVLRQIPERNRFMKGLFAWVGFKSVSVPYERPARVAGTSSWNNWKLWNFALDGLVSFSTIPLRVWTYLGLIVAAISFLYGLYIISRTLILGIDLPGYPSLLTIILFLGGIQLTSIGIIGEYLGRLFIEVKARPLYVVDTVYPATSTTDNT